VLEAEISTWLAGRWILEQDGDSGYGFFSSTNKIGIQDGLRNLGCPVNKWLRDHQIPFYFDPVDSPDLSPIENVWKYVSQKLQALDYIPASVEEMRETINRI